MILYPHSVKESAECMKIARPDLIKGAIMLFVLSVLLWSKMMKNSKPIRMWNVIHSFRNRPLFRVNVAITNDLFDGICSSSFLIVLCCPLYCSITMRLGISFSVYVKSSANCIADKYAHVLNSTTRTTFAAVLHRFFIYICIHISVRYTRPIRKQRQGLMEWRRDTRALGCCEIKTNGILRYAAEFSLGGV